MVLLFIFELAEITKCVCGVQVAVPSALMAVIIKT